MELIDSTGTRQACDRCHKTNVQFVGKYKVCQRCRNVARLAELRKDLRIMRVHAEIERAVREGNAEIDRICAEFSEIESRSA